jgi:copper chaperone CopZ
MNTANLKIDGMHCHACVRRVTAAIGKVEGVKSSKVEIGSAAVDFDPALTTKENIEEAVREAGFETPATAAS